MFLNLSSKKTVVFPKGAAQTARMNGSYKFIAFPEYNRGLKKFKAEYPEFVVPVCFFGNKADFAYFPVKRYVN